MTGLLLALWMFVADARGVEYSQDASQALTSTYSACTLGADGDASRTMAQQARLSLATIDLSSISGAAQITWFVALDSAGEQAITPEQTDDIVDHDADNAGSVARSLEVSLRTSGALYLFAKTDSGTATAKCRVTWTAS